MSLTSCKGTSRPTPPPPKKKKTHTHACTLAYKKTFKNDAAFCLLQSNDEIPHHHHLFFNKIFNCFFFLIFIQTMIFTIGIDLLKI